MAYIMIVNMLQMVIIVLESNVIKTLY